MADQTMEQQEVMLTTSDAQSVLTDTEVSAKPGSGFSKAAATVGSVVLLGAGLGLGWRAADGFANWLTKTVRISKAKKAAAEEEKRKIEEEKKMQTVIDDSADAEKVLADTQ